MSDRDTQRLHGLRRWDEYLSARVKPWGIVRETGREPETGDAVWRIGFPDDTRARIRITDEALRLDEDAFEDLMVEVEEADLFGRVREVRPGGLRIHADGALEERPPEGIERDLD